MNTTTTSSVPTVKSEVTKDSAMNAVEQDPAWLSATAQERAVLKRIAAQRDRLRAAKLESKVQGTLRVSVSAVPADAPFVQRLMVFAKLHPVATLSVAGLAMLLGPRKLIRYSTIAIPLINKFKR